MKSNFSIITTTKVDDAANFVASSIIRLLEEKKRVLFFVTGGSSISVCVKIADLLKNHKHENLTIMLTDERYGPNCHSDSNWYQLIKKGFNLPGAKLIPVLIGEDMTRTTEKFEMLLREEMKNADYKIGLFGIGADGHTAGILPDSIAANSEDFACSYDTPTFSRITITFKVIEKLDEVIAWVQGEEKWRVIKNLEGKDIIDLTKQPAQVFKKVPLLTIFTDYKVEYESR